jgi:hypothetical protein
MLYIFLTGKFGGTPVGEARISLCSYIILLTCSCWIEGSWAEVVVVIVSFCSPCDRITERLNFVVRDITLQNVFVETIVRTTSGTL